MAEEQDGKKRYKYETEEETKAAARKTRHQWDKDHYERSTIYMPKGMNEQIKLAAEKVGKTKRAFTVDAINAAIYIILKED